MKKGAQKSYSIIKLTNASNIFHKTDEQRGQTLDRESHSETGSGQEMAAASGPRGCVKIKALILVALPQFVW